MTVLFPCLGQHRAQTYWALLQMAFVFAWQQLEAARLAALLVAASLMTHPVFCTYLAHLLAGHLSFCHLG